VSAEAIKAKINEIGYKTVTHAFGGIKPPAVAMRCRAVCERMDDDADFRSAPETITASFRNKQ